MIWFFAAILPQEARMPEQLVFKEREIFREWLKKNHDRPKGLWLVFGKNKLIETLTPEEALDEALCFGWIDGIIKFVDEKRYVKFFSPRREKSKWSQKNRATAERLIKSRRMAAPGMAAIKRAKEDGSWERQSRVEVAIEDTEFLAGLIASNPLASANFQKMAPSAKKLYTGYYLDAKQEETKQRRLTKIVQYLEQNKKAMF
jgi:uncharacterized protein YdeI (YjbR/CyaY-like superfamily)